LVRVLPDFSKLPKTPGVKDWSMIDYDTDAQGRPVRAIVSHSTGNKALDEASVKAIKESRFTGGARTGCRYPFWTRAAKLEAPTISDDVAAAPEGATCQRPYPYATAPRLTYPEPYRRRMIEGWAVVSFDVAPWGEIGNVKVVASQPTEEFGTHAVQVIRTAKFNAAPSGVSGCIERVIFKLGADGTKPLEGAEPNPVY
jgi:TonB family protein